MGKHGMRHDEGANHPSADAGHGEKKAKESGEKAEPQKKPGKGKAAGNVVGMVLAIIFIPWIVLPFVLLFQALVGKRRRRKAAENHQEQKEKETQNSPNKAVLTSQQEDTIPSRPAKPKKAEGPEHRPTNTKASRARKGKARS